MNTLTVVVACVDAARSIDRSVSTFERTCRGLDAEIIVADASHDGTADVVAANFPAVRLLRFAPGTLTPVLWAEGYRASSGAAVAFTTGHCAASDGWAHALLERIDHGAAAVGGPLDLADDARPLDWAVFYLRYSAFVAGFWPEGPTEGEIAGDNACYVRALLDRHAASLADGFWEVDVHKLLRADGGQLVVEPRAVVRFGPSFPLATICRHRFAHGRQFGAGRVRDGGRRRWTIAGVAPAVPFVLALRAFSRIRRMPPHRRRFVIALPWFFVLASAWAAGEAWGALMAKGARPADGRAAHSHG